MTNRLKDAIMTAQTKHKFWNPQFNTTEGEIYVYQFKQGQVRETYGRHTSCFEF